MVARKRSWCSQLSASLRADATARLPGGVGADVASPLVLRKIAAGAKTEVSDQFLFVNNPEPDLAVFAAAGQPPVRRRSDKAAMREDYRLARTVPGQSLTVPSVLPRASRPSAQHRQGPDELLREDHRLALPSLGHSLILTS